MPERFAVGDDVTYHDGLAGPALVCRVIKVMPSDNRAGLYHIRNLTENFERSVSGNPLTWIVPGSDDADLAFKGEGA
jgi:hypothetical protein